MSDNTKPRKWAALLACALCTHFAAAAASIVAPKLASLAQQRSTTTAELKGTATVTFSDGTARAWRANSDVAWLVIDTPSSTRSTSLRYHVDPVAATAAVVNWDTATATVTVSSAGFADVRSTLQFSRQLPDITMLTPSQVLPGQASTLTLSGKGLAQLTAIGQITVGDQPVTAGTLVSDSQAIVELPPQANGALDVRVPNQLNQRASRAQVAVKPALAYASLPSLNGQSKTSMVYDPTRQAVFASSWYGSALERYTFNGTKWLLKVKPWAGVWRVQMSPDRQTLYVLSTTGLAEVDPNTLAVRRNHTEMAGYNGFAYYYPLSLTNDLRLWDSEGTRYLNLRSGTVEGAEPKEFFGVAASDLISTPDGAHIYTTEGYYQPPPPNGWFSTSTHSSKALPPGLLNFNYFASFDEQGKMGVFNGDAVYRTVNWSLVGLINPPNGMLNFPNAVMSPDGLRVYALTAGDSYQSSPDRVSVYTTSRRQQGTSQLIRLGSIPVPDPAAQCNGEYECDSSGRLAISPTGRELFWAGNKAFTVIPVPVDLLPPGAALDTP